MKKLSIFLMFFGLLFLAGCSNSGLKPGSNSTSSDLVFYYGASCPHCKNVEAYLEENKVEDKIKINKKEVFDNKDNQSEFMENAVKCSIPQDKLGVPLLYDGEKCFSGDVDIINFFKEKNK